MEEDEGTDVKSEQSRDEPKTCVERPSMVGAPPSMHPTGEAPKIPKKRGRKRKVPLEEEKPAVEHIETEAVEGAAAEETSNDAGAKRKRRKRRKIRFGTDNPLKAKRRAERRERLAAERKESQDLLGPGEGAAQEDDPTASPTKKTDGGNGEKEPLKPSLYTYSPFQLFCDHLVRKLATKDPEEFFMHPVDVEISPDYPEVVDKPMDLSTMGKKVEKNGYRHLDEMREDVELIAANALLYNGPGSIYHLAAQKLKGLADYYFSAEYLNYLRYSLPFGRRVDKVQLGLEKGVLQHGGGPSTPSDEEELDDGDSSEAIVKSTSRKLRKRLVNGKLAELGYLDMRGGSRVLNLLTGVEKSRITLGSYVSALDRGTPGVLQPFEPRLCVDYPIVPLPQAPYSSFALQYDSTWATLSKEGSDLMTAYYGSHENAADAMALRQMVEGAGSFLSEVDDYLDHLTDGEHRKVVGALGEEGRKSQKEEKLSSLLESVKTLENIGLDLSFVDEMRQDLGLTSRLPKSSVNQRLRRAGTMVNDLAALQYNRLSTQPHITLVDAAEQPSAQESELACRVIDEIGINIQEMSVRPNQLVSSESVQHALTSELNEEEYDVLREFVNM